MQLRVTVERGRLLYSTRSLRDDAFSTFTYGMEFHSSLVSPPPRNRLISTRPFHFSLTLDVQARSYFTLSNYLSLSLSLFHFDARIFPFPQSSLVSSLTFVFRPKSLPLWFVTSLLFFSTREDHSFHYVYEDKTRQRRSGGKKWYERSMTRNVASI